MSIASIAYGIVIEPLILIVELVFALLYRVLGQEGPAIVGVSLVVSVLVLPLYRMADDIQQKERDKQASMAFWVNHIKKHFSGDEQYMILSTYYRQRHYNQLSQLKSSLSLLLQIPFFIAAYRYLSGLQMLSGTSFGPIADLSQPDALINLGGLTLNVLPIAMTVLNIASSSVYTRGLALRDKLQTYGLALVFLVLLYNSPSGLVLYWTCNQIFSLIKNIFSKVLKDPRRDMAVLVTVGLASLGAWLVFTGRLLSLRRKLVFGVLFLACELVVLLPLFAQKKTVRQDQDKQDKGRITFPQPNSLTFLLLSLAISVLMGITIPTALFGASPEDFFAYVYTYVNPLSEIAHTFCVCIGLFGLWVGVYYYLSDDKGRSFIILAYLAIIAAALVNYFGGREYGIITSGLMFEQFSSPSLGEWAPNLMLGLAAALALIGIYRFKPSVVTTASGLLAASLVIFCIPSFRSINEVAQTHKKMTEDILTQTTARGGAKFDKDGNILPITKLSKKGKNVVLIFLDRGIGGYLPYFLQEKPELADMFDGFVYYPNALSCGGHTIFTAPSIYGGYEYNLEGMETRPDVSLVEKGDEALCIVPSIMSKLGYDVTLADPPRIDWLEADVDYNMFEGLENVQSYRTQGAYIESVAGYSDVIQQNFLRNLFFYSVLKVSPMVAQGVVYDDGQYYSTAVNHNVGTDFISSFSVLMNLGNIVEVVDDDSNNVFMMHNNSTHAPELLELPTYTPSLYIHDNGRSLPETMTVNGRTLYLNGVSYGSRHHKNGIAHYEVNMACMLTLGSWFDQLREAGAWDNTRIVVVSDHGYDLAQWEDLIYNKDLDIERVNPLFLVKDFNARGDIQTNNDFMTIADVPSLLMDGLVENPTNPYTGNPINMDAKQKPQMVTTSRRLQPWKQTGNVYVTSDRHRYTVHDNIYDHDNWQEID